MLHYVVWILSMQKHAASFSYNSAECLYWPPVPLLSQSNQHGTGTADKILRFDKTSQVNVTNIAWRGETGKTAKQNLGCMIKSRCHSTFSDSTFLYFKQWYTVCTEQRTYILTSSLIVRYVLLHKTVNEAQTTVLMPFKPEWQRGRVQGNS